MQFSTPEHKYPISHLFLAGAITTCLVFFLLDSEPEEDTRFTTELVLQQVKDEAELGSYVTEALVKQPELLSEKNPLKSGNLTDNAVLSSRTPSINTQGTEEAANEMPAEKALVPLQKSPWNNKRSPLLTKRIEKVRSGDSMAAIFTRLNISAKQLQLVLDSSTLSKRLKRIYPGHELEFLTGSTGQLIQLTYRPSPLESLTFRRNGKTFKALSETRKPETNIAYQHAVIDNSLFLAGQRAGFNDDLTLRLAHIFQWDIDFVLDIRAKDQFHVVFEELYLDGEFLGYGQILAAEFRNQNQVYRAVRYTDSAGQSDYYNPNGDNMRKAFLRAPVEFSRISSNFNPRRLHPVRKRIAPHRGIDYAAPTGTPILAAGDGKVVAAKRSGPNGNYIFIQHGEQFQTKYLHLSKFARGVRYGKKVSQGQVIGYVGSTGWATASHLHYEFLVNGVHKNPRTVKLPKADAIPSRELDRFKLAASEKLDLLDNYKQQKVASLR